MPEKKKGVGGGGGGGREKRDSNTEISVYITENSNECRKL